MNVLTEIRHRFLPALSAVCDDPAEYLAMIRPTLDAKFGDFQANFAMPLAKKLGRNPREIAAEIAANVDVADLCQTPVIAGPGFINLTLRDDWLQQQVNTLVNDDRLGVPLVENPKTFVVDFSAPNVAKPMHVGHLRSTVIGAALRSVLKFLGHGVIGDNHIGDWGTQFGMIIYGYKQFRDETAYQKDPVQELARLYRLVNHMIDFWAAKAALRELKEKMSYIGSQLDLQKSKASTDDAESEKQSRERKRLQSQMADVAAKLESMNSTTAAFHSDPTLMALLAQHQAIAEYARIETAKLHAGDPENIALWSEFLPHCLAMLQRIYDRLGVEFDETLGESFYQPLLADVVADLKAKGLAVESEGAVCVFNEGFDAPFIVQKSDGAFTYATTDLATIRYRVEQFQADELLYVVDGRQSEHFAQLFATAKRWGYDVPCRHIKFGTIMGPDKKPYKTRSGDTVGLESLLDEAVARARQIVDANDDAKPEPELTADERADVAEAVGIGGIKYADLNHNRESDYVFSWEKMLAKEGDTATYMQYAYARVCGIFRKGSIDRTVLRESQDAIRVNQPAERALAWSLCRFAEAVDDVAADYRPNLLTQYLFTLANQFSTFYDQCPVLKDVDEQTRTSRLLLCDLTARVIDRGLGLLGIRTCERM